MTLGYLIDDTMVTVGWATCNVTGLIKTIKFAEVAASNMFAVTSLAIGVNLALIVVVSNQDCFTRNLHPWCSVYECCFACVLYIA